MGNASMKLSRVIVTITLGFYKIGKEAKELSKTMEELKNLAEAVGIDPDILFGDNAIGSDQEKGRHKRSKYHYAISSKSMNG